MLKILIGEKLMINNKLKLVTALSCALGVATPASVFATNGMFLIAPGTKSRGMGGVSITRTHDTLTSAINPATMAHTGNRFDIGGDIFAATSEATLGEAGINQATVESKPEHMAISPGIYIMPNMGASWNEGDLSYGFTMVPVGGGGSQYDFNLFNNVLGGDTSNKMGVSLMVMNINPTIAYKLDENNSVGATLIIGLQVFKAYGLEQFLQFTSTQDETAQFTNNGTDISYGAGVRLGWLGIFGDMRFGAEYTSQTYMSKFDDYKDLFAEQGQMNTPGNIGLGASYDVNKKLTVALDINYIMYEDVAAVSNPGPDPRATTAFPVDRATNALGEDEGLGFGWSNQTVFKLGLEYLFDNKLTLRGGWNYGESPINEETSILFNITAPAVVQHHLTMGATYQLDKESEVSISYVHAFESEQFGPTYIGSEGSISMSQNSIGMTYSMNF